MAGRGGGGGAAAGQQPDGDDAVVAGWLATAWPAATAAPDTAAAPATPPSTTAAGFVPLAAPARLPFAVCEWVREVEEEAEVGATSGTIGSGSGSGGGGDVLATQEAAPQFLAVPAAVDPAAQHRWAMTALARCGCRCWMRNSCRRQMLWRASHRRNHRR